MWYAGVFGLNKALTRVALGITFIFGTKAIENHEVTGILFTRLNTLSLMNFRLIFIF